MGGDKAHRRLPTGTQKEKNCVREKRHYGKIKQRLRKASENVPAVAGQKFASGEKIGRGTSQLKDTLKGRLNPVQAENPISGVRVLSGSPMKRKGVL